MKRTQKITVRLAAVATLIIICCFVVNGQRVKALQIRVEEQIAIEEKKLAKEESKLEDLTKEMEQIDTLEYIEKVATDQLGLVKEDTIVFKAR